MSEETVKIDKTQFSTLIRRLEETARAQDVIAGMLQQVLQAQGQAANPALARVNGKILIDSVINIDAFRP